MDGRTGVIGIAGAVIGMILTINSLDQGLKIMMAVVCL